MPLSLEPLTDDPWVEILEALGTKIKNPDLSLAKYLQSINQNPITVFDQTGEDANNWDPPVDRCPAVVLLTGPFPFAEDKGIGDERWSFSVMVLFKMHLENADARQGIRAVHELIRTIFYSWRTAQLDPLQAITGVYDYDVEGDFSPFLAAEAGGRWVARAAFTVRFKMTESILG